MKNTSWFTLAELLISISISSIIIFWISLSISKISQNFSSSLAQTDIYSDVWEFFAQKNMFDSASGKVLSGWVLLYDEKGWVLIGSFLDTHQGADYTFSYDPTQYKPYYFWYFFVNSGTVLSIIDESINFGTLKLNRWAIYKKMLIQNISVKAFPDQIYEMSLDLFKKAPKVYGPRNEIFIPKDDILTLSLNF